MPDDVLADVRERAERADPQVRATALLRIARVETIANPGQARATFLRGLDELHRISGADGESLLEHARYAAAAVAPDLLIEVPHRIPEDLFAGTLLHIMLEHGQEEAAFSYLMRYDDSAGFPFGMVPMVTQRVADEAARMALLRRGIEHWRNASPSTGRPPETEFIPMFHALWKTLPREEAWIVVREIVGLIYSQEDQLMLARYGETSLEITSMRSHNLFQILGILRVLDPGLAQEAIANDEQLATAARRYPNGMESVREEAEARRKNMPRKAGGGYIMMGSPDDFPFMRSLMEAKDGDYRSAMEHALERYRADSDPADPNRSPREFWPSTSAFMSVLYEAGKRLGADAAVYLEQIPDGDLRLFAQIELAAALAGLPKLRGLQREHRPHKRRSPRTDASLSS